MLLNPREAAQIIGCTERAVRDRLQSGRLRGVKRGGRWQIARADLPLTDEQRRAMQDRAAAIRTAVDDALPSRAATRAETSRRSLADDDVFRAAAEVERALRGAEGCRVASRWLRAGALAVACAHGIRVAE